jgi:hypothetical protein
VIEGEKILKLEKGLKFFIFILFTSSMFISSISYGQYDPNNPASPNYKGKTTAVYQKKFFATVGTAFGRGLDQYSEAYGNYSFSGSYSLSKSSLTVNLDYSHPLDGDTDNTDQWRFEDIDFVWNAPALKPLNIRGQSINLIPRYTYRAPLSKVSQNSTTYGSLISTLIVMTNVGRFAFILSPQLSLSYHQYQTRDVAGSVKNVPVALSMAGTIRALVIKNLYLTGSYFYYQGFDYDLGSVPVNGLSSSLYYQATPKVGLTAFTSWRDRVYSNNSLFDGDTSSVGLGMIASF